jgi:preprotein translocase subunit SecA
MRTTAQETYRRLKVREERTTPRGLDAVASTLTGWWRRRSGGVRQLKSRALQIEAKMAELADKSDAEIVEQTQISAIGLLHPDSDPSHLIAGLAGTAIGAQRALGLTPYREQLQGALAIFDGYLAEMATGEGKTLTIGLAAALMGLTRQPCHVVTANDYLAERDATDLAAFYRFFALRVDFVVGAKEAANRMMGYAAHVTYSTPKEVLADFLRDQLKMGRIQNSTRQMIRHLGGMTSPAQGLVLRGLYFGIVDEADSVLIDEAITPLIISRPVKDRQLEEAMRTALDVCRSLRAGTHYDVDFRHREVYLSDAQWELLTRAIGHFPPWWRSRERFREAIHLTLTAREFYRRDIHYAVTNDKIELIDESTGRIMPHRTWQQGVQQAVEIKENLPFSANAESMASLSFQRFFRCYPRLAGLSGTAREGAPELWQNYQLAWIRIPTHRPVIRTKGPGHVYHTRAEITHAVTERVEEMRTQGRPVLIGTRTVRASEELAAALTEAGVPFRLLNACRNHEEASIIAEAGQSSQVTIATNMAGRGTDIKLGPGVAGRGGLHVLATESNTSGRIDRQLLGRAGRQGDPGSGEFLISLEDDLLIRYLPASLRKMLSAYLHVPKWGSLLARAAFAYVQHSAEWEARGQRRRTLEADTWLDEHLTFAGRTSMLRQQRR